LDVDHFAVVSRSNGETVVDGFKSDREAWSWIVNRLDERS
jgi:hypothetical protein